MYLAGYVFFIKGEITCFLSYMICNNQHVIGLNQAGRHCVKLEYITERREQR